jgi:diguanylate cyclase (GGDEF)-like protein
MFALPSGVVALYGSRPMMTLQVVAVVIGASAILRQLALSPVDLAIQCIATLLATISPALAVLMLRDRLVQALERERDLGLNDLLTGVRNRRGLEAAMPRMLAAARASGLPVGVVLLDIDHFKQVNDTYGHTGGDLVLRHVAARLLAVVRDNDTVSRLGGEEFVVLCVIDPEDLRALGERLRRDISQDPPHRVTVSLGATWFHPGRESSTDDPEQIWALIDRADQLMYQAKREGRDRLCIAAGDSKGTLHAQPRTSGQAGWTPSRQEAPVPPVERLTP